MRPHRIPAIASAISLLAVSIHGAEEKSTTAPPLTIGAVLEASEPADWMPLDQSNTLYMKLPGGQVVMRLASEFAPGHVANIKALAREGFFDGLVIVRSQENYVVQWGDPAEEEADRRPIRRGKAALPAEFDRLVGDDISLTRLPDGDVYAEVVGFVNGFPVAMDTDTERIWMAHCYGMMGAGRGEEADSGGGAELYVVIGHSPRHLDRNVTLTGRVIQGMEVLTTLPRGTGTLGFYEDPAQYVPIEWIRLGSDLPEVEQVQLEILRTDTKTFRDLVESRRNRLDPWFVEPTGRISLCNVPIPVRQSISD